MSPGLDVAPASGVTVIPVKHLFQVSDSQVLHTLHKANMNIHSLDISRSKDRFLNLVLEFEPVEGHTFPITILIR